MKYRYFPGEICVNSCKELANYLNDAVINDDCEVVSVQWKYREETRYSSEDTYFVLLRRPMHLSDA